MFKNIYIDRKASTYKIWLTNGKTVEHKFKCRSWVENPAIIDAPYKTIYGVPVMPVMKPTYEEQIDRSSGNMRHEMDIQPEIRVLSEYYEKEESLDFKISDFNVFSLDIETEIGLGFPEPELAERKITLISCYDTFSKQYKIFGLYKIDRDRFHQMVIEKNEAIREKFPNIDITNNYQYIDCYEDEEELLNKFFTYFSESGVDIVTGWNTETFDLPYIINRAKKLCVYSYAWMSPVNKVYVTRKYNEEFGRFDLAPVIAGVSCIDYLRLYKEFNKGSQKASYKLDYIANLELHTGKAKLGDSGLSLANKDFTAFTLYNLVDTVLIPLFEDKLQMLESLIGTCAEARIPFEYFFVSKRVVLGFFLTVMHREGLVIPFTKDVPKEPYDGAYIKINPKPYRWVASYDAKAMYPSIIRSCNISPETKMILSSDPGNCSRSILRDVYYRNDVEGIIPKITKMLVVGRDAFKENQKKYSNPERPEYDPEKAAYYKRKQNAYKIFANSIYGLLGNNHFQFYDVHNAATITGIGNRLIQHVITYSTTWMDTKLPTSEKYRTEFGEYANVTIKGTLDKDYIDGFSPDGQASLGRYKRLVLAHTDSFFFDYSDLYGPFENKKRTYEEYLAVKNRFSETSSPDYNKGLANYFKDMHDKDWDTMSFTEFMLRFNFCVFDDVMSKITKKWSTTYNYREDHMWFKLEKCCNNLIAMSKAHYICYLQYDEGDLLMHQPFAKRLKAVGVELIKADTPTWSKDEIMKTLEMLFSGATKAQISRAIGMLNKDYRDPANIERISRPASINTLQATKANTFPAPRKGAIIWNGIVKSDPLFADFESISEGTKVKWIAVKEPNKFGIGAISYNCEKWPVELNKYFTVDFDTQFYKTFRRPLEKIMECYGWGNIFDGNVESIRRFFKPKV